MTELKCRSSAPTGYAAVVGVHGILTTRARRDCKIRGVDPDEIDDVLNNPLAVQHGADRFDYYLGRLADGRRVELTCTRPPLIQVYAVVPMSQP